MAVKREEGSSEVLAEWTYGGWRPDMGQQVTGGSNMVLESLVGEGRPFKIYPLFNRVPVKV